MKIGYIKKGESVSRDTAVYMQEYLKYQGAETVIIDNKQREALPELLQSLNPGDTLYLFNMWHLSMNTTRLMDILERLRQKDVMLFIGQECCDLKDEQTNFELTRAMEYHNETAQNIRNAMKGLQKMREKRKGQD